MNIVTGIIRFRSLAEAIRQGYQVHDQTPTGYLLRIMTAQGWAMALYETPDVGDQGVDIS